KQQGGTGLGLYMSKIIIETSMAGKLLVRNFDNGTEFTITMKKGNSSGMQ
ncbi:hypothetical protein MBAV_004322, partial [Candidatus Magnetobacterium bavaricum]